MKNFSPRETLSLQSFALMMVATYFLFGSSSALGVKIGEPAPTFADVKGINGKTYKAETYSLDKFKGKFIVLEWHNQGCPYVKKFYKTGAMQKLQSEWKEKGVTWLTVITSAPGKQGHVTAGAEKSYLEGNGPDNITQPKAEPTAVLFDSDGKVGKLYGAKTTPHLFIVDPKGTLIYDGAIDDKPTTDEASVKNAKNYVSLALTEAMAGKPVAVPSTPPYGCSVKYAEK